MGDSINSERPKSAFNKAKKAARVVALAGFIASPAGAGHLLAEPTNDVHNVVQGTVRTIDAIMHPKNTTLTLLVKGADALLPYLNQYNAPKSTDAQVERTNVKTKDVRDIFFAGYSDEEKSDLQAKIDNERDVFIGSEAKGLPGALTEESFITIAEVMPILEDIEKVSHVPKEVMIGMIFLESQGRRDAVSPSGAVDLLQMMPAIMKKYNIEPRDLSRKDDKEYNDLKDREILTAGARELREAKGRWDGSDSKNSDWGLAVWEWHIGAPTIYKALQKYAEVNGIVKMETPTEIIPGVNAPEDSANDIAFGRKTDWQDVIAGNKITFYKLTQNGDVALMLQDPTYNDTLIYVFRAAAGAEIWDDTISLAGKQLDEKNNTPSDDKPLTKIIDFAPKEHKKAA